MSLAAKLIAKDPLFSFHEIDLIDFPLRIGRGPDADVQLGDRWVSREHCEIDSADDALVVRDLGSKHGTFVNGRSVMEAELHQGDELNIGLTRFVVEYQASPTHSGEARRTALVS
jgi:pSer/pThr/pTyr-binding forkhead associated (FHA) protein